MKVHTYTDIEDFKKLLLDGMFTNPDWGFFRIRTLKDYGTFINIEDFI